MAAEAIEYPTLSVHDWLQALCLQGGLTIEGDETDEELSEAVAHLVQTYARR